MIRFLSIVFLLTTADIVCGSNLALAQRVPAVSVRQLRNTVTLSNGFVQLTFDRTSHRVIHFSADHTGHQRFRLELLAPEGMALEHDESAQPATVRILQHNPQYASVCFRWASGGLNGHATVKLTFSLSSRERGVHVQTALPDADGAEGIRVMLRQWFQLTLFDRGAVQYVAGQGQYFTSISPLRLFYTMDRSNGSVALEPDAAMRPAEVSLLSGAQATENGIILRPRISSAISDTWKDGSPVVTAPAAAKTNSVIGFTLYANDLPYPAHREDSRLDGMKDARAREMAAYWTATYGSAAGVLGSYFEPGSAYPTLAHPRRAYGDAFDFFDPDAWETVTTLAYSGDPLLQAEARSILERSEAAQRSDGQIPHHFEQDGPKYLSIAQSSQTGPNIFWTLAATEYAAATGDEEWLRAHYAHMRMATDWVLARYDPQEKLVRADGPLFIDVFRRNGFTLDTNVFAFYLLGRMSEIAAFCNDPATEKRYIAMRESIRAGILRNLWDGHDHFVTERHADGTTRDFVDYDGNFAALAFGILPPDGTDARRLLRRLDNGPHTHPGGYGTWVSERRYEKQDCYGGNDGDSDVAMARIWWLDMAARVQLDDRATFNSLLEKVEDTLLRDVWMPERYDAQGRPAHNGYYHEYPETYAMVLREMRYGVHVGIERVTIHPFDVQSFSLHLGALRVDYSPARVSLLVPGSSERTFTISGLIPEQQYILSTGQRVAADAQGALRFRASAGKLLVISQDTATRPGDRSW
jgi:hypothetical protein